MFSKRKNLNMIMCIKIYKGHYSQAQEENVFRMMGWDQKRKRSGIKAVYSS